MEEALEKLDAGLNKKYTLKKYNKILERIGRLREKNRRVSQDYRIEVMADKEQKMPSALNGSFNLKVNRKIITVGSIA